MLLLWVLNGIFLSFGVLLECSSKCQLSPAFSKSGNFTLIQYGSKLIS